MKISSGHVHLKQSIKGIGVKLGLIWLALFAFQFLFIVLGTSTRVQKDILKDMKDIPPLAQKMFGASMVEAILKYGVMALGYLHPFMLILFVLFIFMSASQLVTSEISSGAIGFTLSKPVSRKRLFLNLIIIVYGGLLCLALATYLSSWIGIKFFFSQKIGLAPFASLVWNLYLVMLFVAGYVMIITALSRSSKMLFTWGGIVLMLFYLMSLAQSLWKPLKLFSPINPFSYYQPLPMLMGARLAGSQSLIVLTVSIIMGIAGIWIFSRRDIPSG